MSSTVIVITDQTELDALLAKNPLVALKFSATWCGPCKAVKPVFEAMVPTYPQIAFASVDIDEGQDVARMYGMTAVPSFLFFHKGIIEDKVVGGDMSKVNACVRKLAEKAPSFGTGRKIGSSFASGSVEPSLEDLRRVRAEKFKQSLEKKESSPEPVQEDVKDNKNKPRKHVAKPKSTKPVNSTTGSSSLLSNLPNTAMLVDALGSVWFFIQLYFFTLFSLDAHAAATWLSRNR